MLSLVQVRSMLESVARTHLAKLDRLAALETADGITPAESRVSDLSMGWARRLHASQGMAATVAVLKLDARLNVMTYCRSADRLLQRNRPIADITANFRC